MRTRAQVCVCIAACALLAPSPAAAQSWTERDLVDAIVRDGPRARAIRAGTEVVRREQRARLAYPNPAFTYSREGAGLTEFFQVEQPLPVFGSRAALVRAGVAAAAAAEADRDARLWALRTEAAGAVARLTAAHARLEAARAYAQDVQGLVEILRVREREGEGSRFDRLRAEQELRDARQFATSAAVEAASAAAAVTALLPENVVLPRVAPYTDVRPAPAAVEALTRRAVSNRAELRALQRSAERADRETEAARRARLPAPALFGGLKRAGRDADRERGGLFGVTVALPLFDAGGREAARWAAERERVEAERASIERQIRVEIAAASEALALRHAALLEDAEGAGDELARIARVAYREGEADILELLDAGRTASRARLRSIDVRLDARLAQIALEGAVGDVLWP